MWPWAHRRRTDPTSDAMNTKEQKIVPLGLNDAHSFVQPGPAPFTEQLFGTVPYSPRLGSDLPAIPNQDRILVHYMQPVPYSDNPAKWYEDRNADKIYRGTQEHFFPGYVPELQGQQTAEMNPWLGSTPQENSHYNARFSPSNYRFVRPFDQQWERTNSLAQTGSEARVMYPYAVGGMVPQNTLRNTFRLAPTARDIENVDLNDTHTASVVPAVYVSPQVQSSRWGL